MVGDGSGGCDVDAVGALLLVVAAIVALMLLVGTIEGRTEMESR